MQIFVQFLLIHTYIHIYICRFCTVFMIHTYNVHTYIMIIDLYRHIYNFDDTYVLCTMYINIQTYINTYTILMQHYIPRLSQPSSYIAFGFGQHAVKYHAGPHHQLAHDDFHIGYSRPPLQPKQTSPRGKSYQPPTKPAG